MYTLSGGSWLFFFPILHILITSLISRITRDSGTERTRWRVIYCSRTCYSWTTGMGGFFFFPPTSPSWEKMSILVRMWGRLSYLNSLLSFRFCVFSFSFFIRNLRCHYTPTGDIPLYLLHYFILDVFFSFLFFPFMPSSVILPFCWTPR